MPIKFVGEPFCVSKEFWYRKVSSKGGGKLHGFVENFFYLTGPKKLRQGTILCFKISRREKYFMDKKGGITSFRRSFCLTAPKYFIGEHFGVSEKVFYQKFSSIGGGRGITVLSKFFVSQDRNEKLCEGTLLSGKFLVSKKIYG